MPTNQYIRKNGKLTLSTIFLLFAIVSAQPSTKTTIAVNDLTGQGIPQSEAIVVSEQLRAEIMKSGKFRIVERSQMQEILKEQGFQQSGCTDDACAVQIGQLLGVSKIIVGTLGKAGSYTVLTARVIDVGTGEVITSESVRNKGGIDKMIEQGIQTTCEKLVVDMQNTQPQIKTAGADTKDTKSSAPAVSPKKKPTNIWLIGGISAGVVVIAGAVTYFMLTSKKSNTNTNSSVVITGSRE